jgi:hypothetical protein
MWIACTNRPDDRGRGACGIGALAFSFVDPGEAGRWVQTYYDLHPQRRVRPARPHGEPQHRARLELLDARRPWQAIRNGLEGFEFFRYAVNALVAHDARPGRSTLWETSNASA